MDTETEMETVSPEILAVIRQIRRAKPKPFYRLKTTDGDVWTMSVADFAKLKPVVQTLADLRVEYYTPLTPSAIARLQEALTEVKATLYETRAGEEYSVAEIEKAKPVLAISFDIDTPDGRAYTGRLFADGTLTVGCQSHKLAVWAKAEQDGSPMQGYFSFGHFGGEREDMIAMRDAVLPVLREKLKALRKAAA